jgi:hypothetical protein
MPPLAAMSSQGRHRDVGLGGCGAICRGMRTGGTEKEVDVAMTLQSLPNFPDRASFAPAENVARSAVIG